jgi:hypothetical protein
MAFQPLWFNESAFQPVACSRKIFGGTSFRESRVLIGPAIWMRHPNPVLTVLCRLPATETIKWDINLTGSLNEKSKTTITFFNYFSI